MQPRGPSPPWVRRHPCSPRPGLSRAPRCYHSASREPGEPEPCTGHSPTHSLTLCRLCQASLHSHARGQSSRGRAAVSVSHTWDQQGRETLPRIVLTFYISGSGLSVKWLQLLFWFMSHRHELVQTKKICVLGKSRVCFP